MIGSRTAGPLRSYVAVSLAIYVAYFSLSQGFVRVSAQTFNNENSISQRSPVAGRKPPIAYRRYVQRLPSPNLDDDFMERVLEVFEFTKGHPWQRNKPTRIDSDVDAELIISCSFDPDLEECKRLHNPPSTSIVSLTLIISPYAPVPGDWITPMSPKKKKTKFQDNPIKGNRPLAPSKYTTTTPRPMAPTLAATTTTMRARSDDSFDHETTTTSEPLLPKYPWPFLSPTTTTTTTSTTTPSPWVSFHPLRTTSTTTTTTTTEIPLLPNIEFKEDENEGSGDYNTNADEDNDQEIGPEDVDAE